MPPLTNDANNFRTQYFGTRLDLHKDKLGLYLTATLDRIFIRAVYHVLLFTQPAESATMDHQPIDYLVLTESRKGKRQEKVVPPND